MIIHPANNEPREYSERIDFTAEHENWGARGEFMVHLKRPQDIISLLKLLNAFEITMRPHFSECIGNGSSQTCVTLRCRTCIAEHMARWTNCLLFLLDKIHCDITYKEGDYGYSIDRMGNVLRKWPLDDGMC